MDPVQDPKVQQQQQTPVVQPQQQPQLQQQQQQKDAVKGQAQDVQAAQDPFAADRLKLRAEADAIAGAGSLGQIAQVINASVSTKKGEAAIKIGNTQKGVDRARTFFTSQGDNDSLQAFVESRYPLAMQDQKNLATQIRTAADVKDKDPKEAANYGDFQWDNTVGGKSNKATVLAPENKKPEEAKATTDAVKKVGGIAKIFAPKDIWRQMDKKLQDLWIKNYGNYDAAVAAWVKQTQSAQSPVSVPDTLQNGLLADDFAPYQTKSAAFSGSITGSMGMADDYDFKNVKDAEQKLGLRDGYYGEFAFIGIITTAILDKTTADAQKAGTATGLTAVGKPSVYTSLMFSEFNYIVEDRVLNTTAVNDKSNSGEVTKDNKGLKEVAVVGLPIASLFDGTLKPISGR